MLCLTIPKDKGEITIILPDGRKIKIISVMRSNNSSGQISLGFEADKDIKIQRLNKDGYHE